MSASKHFEKVAWVVTALMLVITVLFMNGGSLGLSVMAHYMGYENRLFDNTRVHTIDIVMNDWDSFIDNATSEEYYTASLVIDGEAYKNVAIRGKGNTSLSTVSSMNSERYSFKVEFDHYDSSITYHGLDKLSLNNLIQDTTMMKDYLTYTMMNEFGVNAPLCSYAHLTVNGEDWGLYLAVEGVEDSFLERNYGSDHGELYKPDSMSFGGGRGNGKDFDMNDFMNSSESSESSDTSGGGMTMPDMGGFDPSTMFGGNMPNMEDFDFSQIPDMDSESSESGKDSFSGGGFDFGNMGGFGGFGMGSSDVKLQYIDDNISSYSNIWNNAKTDINETDQKRLIESLKILSEGENIESVVDIEQVIRYFVVHNYVCNGDSYTGSMVHNYYLHEENGQMSMIPWDYNLAFGTFQGGNGQSTVNTPIDAPVSGGSGEDRPMWSWILSNEAYTELYHGYFAEFLDTVDIVGIIDNAYELIKSYVAKDPTAFYSYDEFELGVKTIREFCTLRSESISLQLENGETTSNMNYADASSLTLSDMGSMGGSKGGFGGGMGDFGGRGSSDKNKNNEQSTPDTTDPTETTTDSGLKGNSEANADTLSITTLSSSISNMMQGMFGGQMPEGFDPSDMQGMFGGHMPEGFDPSQMPDSFGGELPDGFDTSQLPDSFGTETSNQTGNDTEAVPSETEDASGSDNGKTNRPSKDNTGMSGGNFSPNMSGGFQSSAQNNNVTWLIASIIVLIIGLAIAKVYKY